MIRELEIMAFLNSHPTHAEIQQRLIREAQDHDRLLLQTTQEFAQQQGDGDYIGEQQHH